ncbi:MAG: DegT/DnrJ/EryC1/StrS family aminotransferase, partial [Lachnospiraceae bacterium]|nr:DegT/DnrJ/EryC1/StrS family aminotransferase [Lachnospiraceae bacterium]
NHFEENVEKREAVYKLYESRLSAIDGVRMLKPYREDVKRNYSYCPVFFDEKILGKTRDDVHEYLASKQIYSRKYFYPITSEFECYKDKGFRGDTPVAKKASMQVLTLPMYADLEQEDVAMICDYIEAYLK